MIQHVCMVVVAVLASPCPMGTRIARAIFPTKTCCPTVQVHTWSTRVFVSRAPAMHDPNKGAWDVWFESKRHGSRQRQCVLLHLASLPQPYLCYLLICASAQTMLKLRGNKCQIALVGQTHMHKQYMYMCIHMSRESKTFRYVPSKITNRDTANCEGKSNGHLRENS